MNYAFEYIYLSQLTGQLNSTADQQAARRALSSADDLVKHFAATFHTSPDVFAPGTLVLTPYQKDGLEYWLLQFPTPRREPEALWGVTVRYKDKPFKILYLRDGGRRTVHDWLYRYAAPCQLRFLRR